MEKARENSHAELCRRRTEWMKSHREEYGGQYVALDNDDFVSVGPSYAIAREKAVAAGYPHAYVDYLPRPDENGEIGGWL